ncbi:MAG: hypothetical protein ABSC95_04360 [Acetobacteraceae bacterium]|jgi:hypothetical protein
MQCQRISELSAAELRDRARVCRQMAGSAGGRIAHAGLLKLAARLDTLANAREQKTPTV